MNPFRRENFADAVERSVPLAEVGVDFAPFGGLVFDFAMLGVPVGVVFRRFVPLQEGEKLRGIVDVPNAGAPQYGAISAAALSAPR